MKTAIKTVFATALTAIILTSSAFTTFAQEDTKSISAEAPVSNFNMIQVKGNVRLHLSQGTKESIRIESEHGKDLITVERTGQKLLIKSEDAVPADIYVTVKDLKRIDASGQTEVSTRGTLSISALQIFLQDDALASVRVNTNDLYTVIKDKSNLRLSGASAQHISVKNKSAKLDVTKFAAAKTKTSESVFAALDLDAQFTEILNFNSVALNHTK